MKTLRFAFLIILFSSLISCELEDLTTDDNGDSADIAEGLKEALKVGTDTAVSILAIEDGYFQDQAVKILLPDEMENTINTFKSKEISIGGVTVTGQTLYESGFSNNLLGINIPSLQDKEDDLILGINRAAEGAANTAKPIFVDAITGMTIADANDILFGEDTAATHFLEENTRSALFDEYEPKLDSALLAVQIAGTPVATLYEEYVAEYNSVLETDVLAGNTVGSLMGLNSVTATDLSEHATDKGLDGLFLKVADEEKNIREDPLARVTDILVSVFSKLD